jgi:hypothetical protein
MSGKPYKYVTIDTVTALEEMVMPLAVKNTKTHLWVKTMMV